MKEASSWDQHEGTAAERTKQIEGDKKLVESGDIPEARRYPVWERKAREHFGEVVRWMEVGRRMSRKENQSGPKEEGPDQ